MSRGYADVQFTGSGDLPVRFYQNNVLIIGEEGCRAILSDVAPDGLADLIARMFTTLASAPDLTDEERRAVRERMWKALWGVIPANEPVPTDLPPPADATARELTYWQGVEAGAESIARGVGA